jgi:hypothetical protein
MENGKARFEITQVDMGGWVRVYLARGEPKGEVAKFLSMSLTQWMRKFPDLRVRMIVPITSNGDTTELYAWYDRVLFPDPCQYLEEESIGE